MSQSCFSLEFFSGSSPHFVGIRVFIVGYVWNAKSQFCNKQNGLATRARNWNEL